MKGEKNGNISVVVAPEKNGEKKRFWGINKETLPFKLHFFLFVGGMGAVLPYQSALGITRLGLTASNLAAAFTTQQFLFIILKPSIGYLADYFNRLKAVIVGLTVIQAICCFCMIVIPSIVIQNAETRFNASVEELRMCHLCDNYQEFQVMSSKLPPNDLLLKQSFYCLTNFDNDIEIVEMQCAEQNMTFSHSINRMYKIIHKNCNTSFSSDTTLSANKTSESFKKIIFFFTILSINESQNMHIICFHQKCEKPSSTENDFTLKSLNEHCYSVPEPQSIVLENFLQFHSSLTRNISCDNTQLSNTPLSKYEDNVLLSAANFKTYQFWLFAFCLISSCICISSIFTMSDTACYESVHKTGADYGRTRMWGAISWGLIAPFAGFLNDYTENYMASWCLMVVLCSLQIWNLSKMDLIKPDFSQNILKDLKTVFSSTEFIAFEVGVFLNGMCTGVIWFYLTWFLVSIGGTKLIIGLAHTVQCFFGEVPFMFYSGWMIKKFGHFNLVSLAIFSHGVRFLVYSYIHNPWWILPIECIHGFTFGSFYSAMTSYGKLNSKPGTEATTQSVLCTTYEGLGAGLGCVISGVCFDQFGGHTTFFYAAFTCALATGLNVLSTMSLQCRKGELEVAEIMTANAKRY